MSFSPLFSRLIGIFLFLFSATLFATLPPYHGVKSLVFSEPSLVFTSQGANPALASTLDPYDLNYAWTNHQENSVYIGLPWIGFGAFNQAQSSDYRLQSAWETAGGSSGMALQWGSSSSARSSLAIQWGTIHRLSSQFSIGSAATIETSGSPALQTVFDFGFRPNGTDSLTFGSDIALDNEREWGWSLYSSFRVHPGVWVGVRYYNDKTAMVGVSLELGGLEYAAPAGPSSLQSISYHSVPRQSVLSPVLPPGKRYIELKLPSNLPYQRYTWFDNGPTLFSLLDLIRRAKNNPEVEGISLDLSGYSENGEFIWEIRQALADFKSKGKKVLVFAERANWMTYYLASVGDWIVLDPLGEVSLMGESSSRTYYKGTLDKLGIGVEELKFFPYKTAYESLTREKMSTPDREQRMAFIQSNYTLVKTGICSARSVSENRFDELVSTHPWMMASEAISMGLVDQLGRAEQVKAKWASWNAKFQSTSAGFVLPKRDTGWGSKPVIAIVYALGVCDMDSGIKARKLSKILQSMVDDDEIKAIVLRVDSPGGDGMASDLVAEVMKKARDKKPIIVSQGEYAASGGYWLSMHGKYIVSAPNSLTGSIGVISQWMYNKSLAEWTGVTSDKVKVGDHADLFSGLRLPLINLTIPNRNLTYDEKSAWKAQIIAHYHDFVGRVAQARKKPTDNIEAVAKGRIWSGQDALGLGLVDVLGGLDGAVALAKKSAKISTDTEVDIIQAPSKGMFNLKDLIGVPSPLGDELDDDLETLRFKLKFNGRALHMVD